MKTTKAAIVLAALVGGSALATTADAQHRHRHHHHHGHRASVGIFFGAPAFYYPRYYSPYYYPPYYYAPAVVAAPSAPVYIEQSAPTAAPSQGSTGYWYYCRDTQTYYPYVQQCASPWQQVVPNSTPAS
jgi:hypothetical protein